MSCFSFLLFFARTGCVVVGLLMFMTAQAGTFTDAGTALTAPATSGTGNYTVSFNTAAWGTHHLQEKKDSGSWSNITTYVTDANGSAVFPSIERNVSVTSRTSGTYTYRVRFVAPEQSTLSSGYSNTKVTVVNTVPGIPFSITTPSSNSEGAFTVSWGVAPGPVSSYKLEQRFNGGNWVQIYSGTGLSEMINGLPDGTYSYRVKACGSGGCGSYRTAGNDTIVVHAPGIPPSITITEL